jgi:hypothetical protein
MNVVLRPQEYVVQHLRGNLWLDEESGALVHLEASLPEPVAVGLLAARVDSLTITYDQVRRPAGTWAPLRLEITLHGRAFFQRFDRRQTFTHRY